MLETIEWNAVAEGYFPDDDRPVLIKTEDGTVTVAHYHRDKDMWLLNFGLPCVLEVVLWGELPIGNADRKSPIVGQV